jgi:hypothetical protein
MVIRTSLVLDEQLQVLQVGAIAVAMITGESKVSLEGMTLLTDIDNLVPGAVVRRTTSFQKRGSHEGRRKEEQ